jgi:NodT family efflux transporter outer membrane factor (OMF) lipoprotein
MTGCVVGPDFKAPTSPPASAYAPFDQQSLADPGPGEPVQHLTPAERPARDWWSAFGSPDIDALARAALAGNQTVAGARASLAQAQAAEDRGRASLYPQIDFAASATRLKTSFLPLGVNQHGPVSDDFSIGPSVRYLLDPFGGQQRLREEKHALTRRQAFLFEGAALAVTSDVVRDAIDAARVQSQIDALEVLVADDEQILALTSSLADRHLRTVAEVEAARSQLANERTLLPPMRQQLAVDRDAIAILTGRTPGDAQIPRFRLEALSLPPSLPVSVPANLVRQRPDVRAAEAELHAASAHVGVTTAQLYPSLTLSGSIIQESLTLPTLFTGESTAGFVAASLAAPVFHGGELRAQRREALAAYDGARAAYRQAVLQSCGQVADVLQALDHDAQTVQARQQALDAETRTLAAARARYAVARATVLDVLEAQRELERDRIALIFARGQRYLDTVQLYAALGGGRLN